MNCVQSFFPPSLRDPDKVCVRVCVSFSLIKICINSVSVCAHVRVSMSACACSGVRFIYPSVSPSLHAFKFNESDVASHRPSMCSDSEDIYDNAQTLKDSLQGTLWFDFRAYSKRFCCLFVCLFSFWPLTGQTWMINTSPNCRPRLIFGQEYTWWWLVSR